ncbi:glycosyltransferase family 2 protein [Methylovirgula sp. 4M-Z18]|uniref:glycosyltransferase family 2 protein n=1 Tax=Methylovirgula sp. 4M-Z18 TaxID=2293567 RepID=UPI0018F2FF3B|nr:cellulose synthase catalytic subunit [Methylovirgula sp. 4M-Z18]
MFEASGDTLSILLFDLGMLGLAAFMMLLLDPRRFLDRALFGGFTAALIVAYVCWRWTQTLLPPDWSATTLWQYSYFGFELISIVYTLLSIVVLLRTSDHSALADREEAKLTASGAWPAVDIFICTYNEPIDVLEKSILLARAMDYPAKRIFVLDDTRRGWLKDYCADVGVFYITRPKNEWAKAGNLNNGLRVTEGPDASPLILVLDADFAPHANFLRRTVGLFRDPRVGLVQTPQLYFNADPVQHNLGASKSWIDDQRVFFDIFQPAKDAWDSAFCVGTSFVVRRDRVNEIGGFPYEAVSEDLNLSYTLLRHGYVTRWLNESLSVGLAAEGLPEYITQRARWCLGTIQVALLKTSPMIVSGYTFMQRVQFFHGVLSWLCKPFMLFMLLAPAVYWFFDIPAFDVDYEAFLRYAIPALIVFYAHGMWITRRRTLPLMMEVTHMMSAVAVTWTLITCCYRPFGRPFKVTDKGGDRSRIIVRWDLLWTFGGFLAISLGAIFWSLFGPAAPSELSPVDLLNLVWAGCSAILSAVACLVCFERPRAHREELFETNQPIRIRADGRTATGVLEHLSTVEARIRLPRDVKVAKDASIDLALPGGQIISGTLTAIKKRVARVALILAEQERRDLVVALYSAPNHNLPLNASFSGSLSGIFSRSLGQD